MSQNVSRLGAAEATPLVVADRQASPSDTPQNVKFCPSSAAYFSCISWDQKLRFYNVCGPQAVAKSHELALGHFPLAQAWNASANGCFVALDDGSLVHVDAASQTSVKFAANAAPLLQVAAVAALGCVLAIDSDKGLLVYAANAPGKSAPDFVLRFREQPFSFALDGSSLLLCFSHNKLAFLDVSKINQYTPADVTLFESQLNAPLSAVCLSEAHREFYLGSSDGRIYKGLFNVQAPANWGKPVFSAVHHTEPNSPTFTFLGQTRKRPGDTRSDLYCINALGGHPASRQFLYTAGSDGLINFWDIKERNKIACFSAPGPISCCDLSADGQVLAFGVGYDWSQGLWGLPEANYPPAVGVKTIAQHELSYRKQP